MRPAFVTAGLLGLAGLVVAATSPHLSGAPVVLVVSTLTAVLAVAGLAAQPWLIRRHVRVHTATGAAVLALVAVHVVALVVLSPDDALFAMSPDGPTRARMALISLVLLVVVVLLGLARRRLGWSGPTFRLLHGGFALLATVLGVGHAVLTDGALEGFGTVVLLASGALSVLGGLVAALRRRRARPAVPAVGRASAAAPPPHGRP
ncbi:ferric reductase-like transmembrane domain-containing protein [Actinomycetospora sp. OC33-EN08]|uniref:Ferric reductase-like transmembrane domain-containing protein n=1 Tax=Actinomycetospora aurantiaca TaxID=3129233 RepID=A0ABU8MQR9_9PSEU